MQTIPENKTIKQKLAEELNHLEELEISYYKIKHSGKYSDTIQKRIWIRSNINDTKERIKQLRKEMQNDND